MDRFLMEAPPSGGQSNLGPLLPENYDIVWSLVIFVVVLIVVWRVGLPRINKVLDARSAAIEGNIEQAQAAQREANEALAKNNAILAEARGEAAKVREQARDDAKRIVADARGEAEAERDRIVAQGSAQVEASRAKAAASLRTEVGSLALGLASGVVGQHLADDDNATSYIDRFLEDLRIEHAADAGKA